MKKAERDARRERAKQLLASGLNGMQAADALGLSRWAFYAWCARNGVDVRAAGQERPRRPIRNGVETQRDFLVVRPQSRLCHRPTKGSRHPTLTGRLMGDPLPGRTPWAEATT